jgi:hypothetical protein
MLDTNNLITSHLTDDLMFNVAYEKTRVQGKKYVIDTSRDKAIAVVGNSFNCASHYELLKTVEDVIAKGRTPFELSDAKVKINKARDNAVIIADVTLPNVNAKVITDLMSTTICERIIITHGVDGTMSNQVWFGAIDSWCSNGQVIGEHDKLRKKNTRLFTTTILGNELEESRQNFYENSSKLNEWSKIKLDGVDVSEIIKNIVKSDRKAEKMSSLYYNEVANRGANVFSLYSAFTNYSSYADERNGFSLKNMGNDTENISMWNRELEVSKWISSNEFKKLELVA